MTDLTVPKHMAYMLGGVQNDPLGGYTSQCKRLGKKHASDEEDSPGTTNTQSQ